MLWVSKIHASKRAKYSQKSSVRFPWGCEVFYDASRGESESPAYLQLKRTIHVGQNLGVGIATPEMLATSLSAVDADTPNHISNLRGTDADRKLSLHSHSLRHLQNTELFRLGVADTIITKRLNRRSVAQSYEYDHRSLHEELQQIALPDEWEAYLGEKAGAVAKLIETGRANGPIVKEFKRLRIVEGDESAYGF